MLEVLAGDAERDVGVHGDEAAVGVEDEALVAGALHEALGRGVVEAEVEDRVHHARHRRARAGADADEQRGVRVAEAHADALLERDERIVDLGPELSRHGARRREAAAGLRRDREAGRNRESERGHLGQPGAFSAEQVATCGIPLGLAVTERKHELHGS